MTERELLDRAAEMRRHPTEWERRLWRHLSSSQTGHKFRRQHVIAPYICDFFCPVKGLVVEIDGDTHDALNDIRRDTVLSRRGFATLRFSNADVRDNIEGVLTSITRELGRRADRWPRSPHPNPSLEGEGLL